MILSKGAVVHATSKPYRQIVTTTDTSYAWQRTWRSLQYNHSHPTENGGQAAKGEDHAMNGCL